MEWPKYRLKGFEDFKKYKTYPQMLQYAVLCVGHGWSVAGFTWGSPCLFSIDPESTPDRIVITRRVHDGCHQKVDEEEIWEKVVQLKERVVVDINTPESKRISIVLTDEQMKQLHDAGWRESE